jgi:hypothetical protein
MNQFQNGSVGAYPKCTCDLAKIGPSARFSLRPCCARLDVWRWRPPATSAGRGAHRSCKANVVDPTRAGGCFRPTCILDRRAARNCDGRHDRPAQPPLPIFYHKRRVLLELRRILAGRMMRASAGFKIRRKGDPRSGKIANRRGFLPSAPARRLRDLHRLHTPGASRACAKIDGLLK